ncbi:MAG TPA: PKD domain-containing protein [Candidatus Thermoplasmatota archaeon]|nr:PKD domain-containing protein [Candidatus Thermoplasmatota archaeon]
MATPTSPGKSLATLLGAAMILTTAFGGVFAGTASAAPAEAMRFGMSYGSMDDLIDYGIKPDYATTWVGPWTRDSWGGFERMLDRTRAAGVTPFIQWYYWGDDISPSCVDNGCWSSLHNTWKSRAEWDAMVHTLASKIRDRMGGAEVLVNVETEFNKGGIDSTSYAPTFDRYLKKHIDVLQGVPGVKVVLGFGSWGKDRWDRFPASIEAADLMGFQGLSGSTRQDLSTYMSIGDRSEKAAREIRDRFGKPSIFTDLAVSSYPEPDWLEHQAAAIRTVMDRIPMLASLGVQAVIYRSLRDQPMSTANYYGIAERHWGLERPDGSRKPAFDVWVEAVNRGPLPPPPSREALALVEAEDLRVLRTGALQKASGATGGTAWNVWANAAVGDAFEFPATGSYDVSFRARGSLANGVGAIASLTVDGQKVAEREFRGDWITLTARVEVQAGVREIRVVFQNDLRTSSEDRNLILDWIEIAHPPPPNRAPSAAFTVSQDGLRVVVDGSPSSDPDGPGLVHAWTFGDGTSAKGIEAARTYLSAGTYLIRLEVTDPAGATASAEKTVVVNRAPTAVARVVSSAGTTSTLSAEDSSDPDGHALAYAWSLGDGRTASGPRVTHTWSTPGPHTVVLTVTDELGASAKATVEVRAQSSPSARFTVSTSGLVVTADASGSSDPDGDPLAFAWDFGDGSRATGPRASHAYVEAGTYSIRLTVTDGRGGSSTAVAEVTLKKPAETPLQKREAEAFASKPVGGRITDAGASGGAAWNVWSNGAIGDKLSAMDAGVYRFSIRARGEPAGGVWPIMELKLEGQVVGRWTVDSATWRDYEVPVVLGRWSTAFEVAFTNDGRRPGEDRNLHVDSVSLLARRGQWIEAESFAAKTVGGRISSTSSSGGALWNLWANGHIETTFDVAAAGSYSLVAMARGSPASGVAPRLVASVDGVVVAEWDLDASRTTAFEAKVDLAAGKRVVRLAYVNDLRTSTEDRNAIVDAAGLVLR